MENLLGVMQGRLLPKFQGRYQAHPLGYWEHEFFIAQEIGLDCIEFILDFDETEKNPLFYEGGLREIRRLSEKTGVVVKSICADYFMAAPLHAHNKVTSDKSLITLKRLIESSATLGVKDIVLPCVDQASLKTANDINKLVVQLSKITKVLEHFDVQVCLETDLAPRPFAELLRRIDSRQVTVNYDMGNSASLGYNPLEELDAYGSYISDVHIKDRVLNGGPTFLGEGHANFKAIFTKLGMLNYRGPFIMQAFRDDEGVGVFKKQLDWIRPYFDYLSRPQP
jgi:sugar phosphate isomerase/epimerase